MDSNDLAVRFKPYEPLGDACRWLRQFPARTPAASVLGGCVRGDYFLLMAAHWGCVPGDPVRSPGLWLPGPGSFPRDALLGACRLAVQQGRAAWDRTHPERTGLHAAWDLAVAGTVAGEVRALQLAVRHWREVYQIDWLASGYPWAVATAMSRVPAVAATAPGLVAMAMAPEEREHYLRHLAEQVRATLPWERMAAKGGPDVV